MRTIQRFLPRPREVEVMRIFVKAKPDVAWEAARHFDMGSIRWVRMLFDLRTLPDRIAGKAIKEEDRRLGVDQITDNETGFMILEEIPGKEVLIGAVGQFWHLNIPFAKVKPKAFKNFNTPGWGKLAWGFRVEPYETGSTISLELRTTATDEDSWRRFTRYFMLIGPFSHLIRESSMAHLEAILGKLERPNASERKLPGDDIIPNAKYQLNHSVDIEAPPSIVWRYLMQLGCDRAGWYSIDALDNGGSPSIDHLVEGWETRQVGDHVDATPGKDGFFNVYIVDYEQSFVLGGEGERANEPFKMTWAFALEPIGEDATHLITRVRAESTPKWTTWLLYSMVAPPIHGIMQKSQLRHLKRIAERDALARVPSEVMQVKI